MRNTILKIIICFFISSSWSFAETAITPEQVRKMVASMLQSKTNELRKMNQRIQELEKLTREQKQLIQQLLSDQSNLQANVSQKSSTNNPTTDYPLAAFFFPEKATNTNTGVMEEDQGPEISGFFDTTAQTKNGSNQVFHIGVVELDLDRIIHKGDFAASVALDWFPYGTTPSVQLGAAFIDFHLYDESIPVRGRIFQEPGFHIQVGQFDLPFGSDYQFFAVTDRLTVTPPMTTTRIQQSGVNPANGGFNSPGIRTYGKWRQLTYAVYAINSIYSSGLAVGGRLGYALNNPYQLHTRDTLPLVDFGLSYLRDMDQSEHITDELFAADFSFNYHNLRLVSEFVRHDSNANRRDGNPVLNESAFHVTLFHNLQDWLHEDLYLYGRYQEWRPNYRYTNIDGNNYQIGFIPAISVGMGYHMNDYLTLKMEYTDTFSHTTAEPGFQTKTAIMQLVGSF